MVLTEPKLLPRDISGWLILLKTQYALTSVAYFTIESRCPMCGLTF